MWAERRRPILRPPALLRGGDRPLRRAIASLLGLPLKLLRPIRSVRDLMRFLTGYLRYSNQRRPFCRDQIRLSRLEDRSLSRDGGTAGGPTGQGRSVAAVVQPPPWDIHFFTCFMSAVAVPYCGRLVGR
jgi:hypothetical protein